MGRPAIIENDELLARLGRTFRDVGYEAASLTMLSEATGLKRPSLYHRFPGGKEQMAREVLDAAGAWLEENVLVPLRSDQPPAARIEVMVNGLREFYSNGTRACLLSMLSSPLAMEGPFTDRIRQTYDAWIGALAHAFEDAGLSGDEAQKAAIRTVSLVQGSLVLSRGMGTPEPFRAALEQIARDVPNGGHAAIH